MNMQNHSISGNFLTCTFTKFWKNVLPTRLLRTAIKLGVIFLPAHLFGHYDYPAQQSITIFRAVQNSDQLNPCSLGLKFRKSNILVNLMP